jgi:hypothetical protein
MDQLLSSSCFFSLSTFCFASCDGCDSNHPRAELATIRIQISPDCIAFSVGFANFFLIENSNVLIKLFPSDGVLSVE